MITMKAKVSDSKELLSSFISTSCLWNVAKISVSKHPGSILQTHKSKTFKSCSTCHTVGVGCIGQVVSWPYQGATKYNLCQNFGMSDPKNSLNCKIMIASEPWLEVKND